MYVYNASSIVHFIIHCDRIYNMCSISLYAWNVGSFFFVGFVFFVVYLAIGSNW